MKFTSLLISSLIVFTAYSQDQIPAPTSAAQIIEEYTAALQEENKEKALEALEKVMAGDTSYSGIQAEKSLMLLKLERYEEVIEVCKEGMKLPRSTSNQVFRLNWAYALDELDKKEEAMKVYQDLHNDFPYYKTVSNNIAALHLTNKDYDKAYKNYQDMARLFPFDGSAHFNLGVFAYNEDHFTEAFMALNMCILIDPYSDRALRSLQFLNEIANNSKGEKVPKDGFKLESDEYSELDLLIKNYIALSKKYKVPGKSQIYVAKQNHLILNQLSERKNTDYFFSQFYEPMYDKIIESEWFEQMQLLELIPSSNENHVKLVEKGMKDIRAFNTWFRAEWYELNKFHEINFRDLEGKHQVWYYDNGDVKSIGNLKTDNTENLGDFCFFGDDGVVVSEGYYGENGLNGLWKYYYDSGNKKREITYKDGDVVDTVKLFDKDGALDQEFGYSNNNRNGFFNQYYMHGGLYRAGTNKEGELDGDMKYYFKNGKKEYETTYSDGLLTGLLKEYYVTGDLYREEEYSEGKSNGKYHVYWIEGTDRAVGTKVDGEYDGAYKAYYRNEQVSDEGSFEKGERIGLWKEYYMNGKQSETGQYSNGKLEGIVKLFDMDGILYSEKSFKNDYMISYKFYDKTGKVLSEGASKKKQYTLENYHPNGTIESRGDYKANVGYVGNWESFDEYGNTTYKYSYEEGKLQGKTEKFFPIGQVEVVKHYNEGLLDGAYSKYFQHGQIEQQGYYEKGNYIGTWESYYEDGAIEWRRNFFNNNSVGENIEFDVAGKLDFTEQYDNDILLGATYYDSSSTILTEIDLKNGEGVYKKLHLNNQVGYTGRYVVNSKEGKFQWFYPNGQLQAEGIYSNNKTQGEWVGYHINGKMEYKGKYVNGYKEGVWEYFYDNGQVSDITPYLFDDIHGVDKEYNKNGTIQNETNYEFGSRHGEMKFHDDNGAFQMSRIYNRGEIVTYYYLEANGNKKEFDIVNGTAEVRAFFKNGKPSRQFNLVKGNFDGPYKAYFENGQVELDYNLVNDEREGVYKMYYDNGKLRQEINYEHGMVVGLEKVFHKNGKLKRTATYRNGKKHGPSAVYNENGTVKKKYMYYDGFRYDK